MFTGLRGLESVTFPAELPWFEIDVVLAGTQCRRRCFSVKLKSCSQRSASTTSISNQGNSAGKVTEGQQQF
jgi:hypothetical protein